MKNSNKSLIERLTELNEFHNSNVPDSIKRFWNSIIQYSDILHELGSEGNSGEFHDEKEAKKLEKEYKVILSKLIEEFSANTGYTPEYIKLNEYFYYDNVGQYIDGIWKLNKNN